MGKDLHYHDSLPPPPFHDQETELDSAGGFRQARICCIKNDWFRFRKIGGFPETEVLMIEVVGLVGWIFSWCHAGWMLVGMGGE